ncbi:50S ribosomal protein L25 [Candidatus Wolfebacteria bacterium]|nr:50S ribosomal protein L25 [Candidatus Wolfebacteria bacterium]
MELQVKKREILGKKVKNLRKENLIPAELYGHGRENIHLSVPSKEFSKILKEVGENAILKLKLEGDKDFNVLINDFQKNSLTDKISHIDFQEVKMDEKITTSIPLEFIGEAPAVKEKGGILVKAMQEIELTAFPADLPRSIKIDLAKIINIGESIYVKDIDIPEKVELLVDSKTVIATVTEMEKEEIEKTPITVEKVKVEGEEKKEKEEDNKNEEK